STPRPMAERMRDCRHIWCAAWGVHRRTVMATITALCCDEATVVLCSGLRGQGFEVAWLYTDELRHGRIEPEVLSGGEPPDLILYDLEEPVDESLLLLTLFRSLPDMDNVPVVLLRTAKTPLPPPDAAVAEKEFHRVREAVRVGIKIALVRHLRRDTQHRLHARPRRADVQTVRQGVSGRVHDHAGDATGRRQ